MSGLLGSGLEVYHARELAQRLLVDLPERWRHTIGVARRAVQVAGTVGAREREILLAAAWLHDIGYANPLHDTGFHPIDGARYLQAERWPARIVGLVAHHSGARCLAEIRGLETEVARFSCEDSAVSDALIYADQTVGCNGHIMSVEQRLAEVLQRHGPHSCHAAAHAQRAPLLRAATRRVEDRLVLLGGVSVGGLSA